MQNPFLSIQIPSNFKSISPGELSLPQLTIVSGQNGSGKTHLLECLAEEGRSKIVRSDGSTCGRRKYVGTSALKSHPSGGNPGNAQELFSQYAHARNPRGSILPAGFPSLEQRLRGPLKRTVEHVARYSNKNIEDLNQDDFLKHAPIDDASSASHPFSQEVEAVFNRYNDKKLENHLHEFDEWKGVGDGSYLPPEAFLAKFGDPISEFNELLKSAQLGYHFNRPEELRGHDRIWNRQQPFQLRLIDDETNDEISISSLSSGERVILSLVFAMYNGSRDHAFADILLLDEPDAHLHPSMVRQFLGVVNKVFLDRGIAVVIATHSPTTVALSPDHSLYVMERRNRWPRHAEKSVAIKALLADVPTIRIDYENRRQVFVESKNDVYFYENFYDSLKPRLDASRPIHFISSGQNGSGDCEQVRKVVRKLRESGNKTIFGIIDWDGTSCGNDGVKVLGSGNRHSIENFIFDPLLLGVFLFYNHFASPEELGLSSNTSFFDVPNLPNMQLQSVVDYVSHTVAEFVEEIDYASAELAYVGGMKLRCPDWYIKMRGKDLQEAVSSSFPPLKRIKNLPLEILGKIVSGLPSFIPVEILQVFAEIQQS